MQIFDAASPIGGFPALEKVCQPGNIAGTMRDIRDSMNEDKVTAAALMGWLNQLSPADRTILCDRSVERPSHFKWFLGDNPEGYIIWLHEYKADQLPDAAGSFAASVHNHRYSFVSQIVTGSLQMSDFVMDPGQQLPRQVGERTIGAQTVYMLDPEQIHRVGSTARGTCTLVVQGPPERPYSRVFDLAGKTYRDMYDIPSRFPELISLLSSSCA